MLNRCSEWLMTPSPGRIKLASTAFPAALCASTSNLLSATCIVWHRTYTGVRVYICMKNDAQFTLFLSIIKCTSTLGVNWRSWARMRRECGGIALMQVSYDVKKCSLSSGRITELTNSEAFFSANFFLQNCPASSHFSGNCIRDGDSEKRNDDEEGREDGRLEGCGSSAKKGCLANAVSRHPCGAIRSSC